MFYKRVLFVLFPAWLMILSGGLQPAHAWDSAGHKVVAQIAADDLDPASAAAKHYRAILKADPRQHRDSLLWCAVWPDAIKAMPKVRKDHFNNMDVSGAPKDDVWHYVDIPFVFASSGIDDFINMPDKTPDIHHADSANVVTAIRYYTEVLQKGSGSAQDNADALSWLVHLVGDVHQPLHCVDVTEAIAGYAPPDKGDRGGNGFRLLGLAQKNLHAFWDDRMDPDGQGLNDEDVDATASALEAAYPLEQDQPDDPLVWAKESYSYRKFAYSTPEHQKPDQKYITKASTIGKLRVATAGHRLAMLLSEIWP